MWSSDGWRELATAWLDAQLARAGIDRTGAVEQPHLRPWATLLCAPTSAGRVWLKATGTETAFEVPLYALLRRVAPGRVLEPLAIEPERGWVLLPDGGEPLGERVSREALPDALATVLPLYGQLQRDLMPHAHELLALGVADMRPEVMPERFDEALAALDEYVRRVGTETDRDAHRRVVALRDTVGGWCERLAAAPVPPSLDHNDLHPWNVVIAAGEGIAGARFYDWGDGVVACPFASMMLGLGYVESTADARSLERLRDGYLEVFDDLGSRDELIEALELACRVGKVARALTWHRAISALGWDAVDAEWVRAPIDAMASLLDDSHLAAI